MRRYMLTFSGTTALLFALLGSHPTPTLAQTQDGPLNMTSDISNRQDIRQDVRGDFRFLNTDLKDARQDVAKLNADLAAKADAATIAADMNKLNADLKDASFHQRDLRGDFRELQSDLKDPRRDQDRDRDQDRVRSSSTKTTDPSNQGGTVRGLDRANQVAGEHGQQGRDNAMNRQDIRQ